MSTSNQKRVALKKFHVFKNPVPIKGTKEDSSEQIINQMKPGNFKATYIEPFVIICDLGTKLTFVIKPGDKPNIFRTVEDPLFIKGTPFKNCPLVVVGNDVVSGGKALVMKLYAYSQLNKVIFNPFRKYFLFKKFSDFFLGRTVLYHYLVGKERPQRRYRYIPDE